MTIDEHGVAAVRGAVDHVQERDRRRATGEKNKAENEKRTKDEDSNTNP